MNLRGSPDSSLICGEYKLWIHNRCLISPVIQFFSSCRDYSETDASKQPQTNQKMARSYSRTAVIHYPNVIDIPTLSKLCTKAKLTLLSSISTGQDPLRSELTTLLMEDYFTKSQCIPNTASKLLDRPDPQ